MNTIFQYDDYRKYLRDWLYNQPRRGRGILRKWSELLRVNPSILSQILSGKRELSLDQAYELQVELALGEIESEYFFTMVTYERAASHRLKTHLKKKLELQRQESLKLSKRLGHERQLSDTESAIFYSSWVFTAVWLSTNLPSWQSVDAISKRLGLERERIVEVLQFLMDVGLVTEELGRYRSQPQRTHLENNSPFIVRHHSNWRMQAIRRAEDLKKEELMFSGPLSISREDFKKVREQIVALIRSVSDTVKETQPEDLAVFQVDLFWMK